MLHLALHWPAQANISFWPQSIEYSVWVFNRMPNAETGISPNKIWSSVWCSMEEFSRAHVFGCPVYVLDAALQDGHKIPKWSPRSRLGLFLGFSDLHSSQVPLILNVQQEKYHLNIMSFLTKNLRLSTLYQRPRVLRNSGCKSFAWIKNASLTWITTKMEMQFYRYYLS